jgi:hypothetical protein
MALSNWDLGVRVRLKKDLSKYLVGLVEGSEGYTIGEYGECSRRFDHFAGVDFPGIGKLDVTIDSLEIIDDDYLNKFDYRKKEKFEKYKSAKNIEVILGPQRGFKYLHFEYMDKNIPNSVGIGYREEAEEIIEYFKRLKKYINIKIQSKNK